ncbi:MAG: DUF3316 domain-containing protein [Bacteroidales bacterium]|nr:DUF3316 domain-containing protein [Bacteroidales bacterium]
MKQFLLTLMIITGLLQGVDAQSLRSNRFEEYTLSLGGGYTGLIDTYLSPLCYGGGHVALQSERFGQLTSKNGRWFAQSLFTLHGDYTVPRSGSGLTIGGMADYSYTYYYRPLHEEGWSLYAGSQGQLRMGGIYNLRNSNNPAQLKLGVNLAASVMGKYAFILWHTPMSVRLQADVPLLGFAFAPNYGQSYYEIFYLGQDENCVHVTALHNNLSLRTGFSYDVQFHSCTVRLSLLSDLYHWTLGNQQYRMFTHSLMLGYVSNLYHVLRDDEVKRYIPY